MATSQQAAEHAEGGSAVSAGRRCGGHMWPRAHRVADHPWGSGPGSVRASYPLFATTSETSLPPTSLAPSGATGSPVDMIPERFSVIVFPVRSTAPLVST